MNKLHHRFKAIDELAIFVAILLLSRVVVGGRGDHTCSANGLVLQIDPSIFMHD